MRLLQKFWLLPLFIILFSVLLVGCDNHRNISIPSKSISKTENYLFAEGWWQQKTGSSSSKIIPRINFVSITCDKNSMRCEEVEAFLWSRNENAIHPDPLLYTQSFDYVITEWTPENVIKAERRPPVADVEIKISLKDNFAEKNYRETKVRGSTTANPRAIAS